MDDGFIVKPLKCNHCGHQLPVMGQFVTFQCTTCFNYWVLTPEGLAPITVYRAIHDADIEQEPLYLPFWAIAVDSDSYRKQMEVITGELQKVSQAIINTNIQLEDDQIERLASCNPDLDIGLIKTSIVCEASTTKKIPSSSEINYLLSRIRGTATYLIYVPAFQSRNTFTYLKVGRLLTKRQPSFKIEKSRGLGHRILCALQADEAVALMDFIFIATLPDSIQQNGDFLKDIHIEPDGSPRLIEFPFEHRGTHLLCLLGNFTISRRLVDGLPRVY